MKEITKACPLCGIEHTVSVKEEDYEMWLSGALIQRAFPYLSAEEREIIITGICPECWDKMFGTDK